MRYLILLAAVVMQMCLGATYSWNVYVQPLKALTGLQQGPVQMPFTVFYFVFPIAMMVAGNLLPRLGPRRSAMLGGLLFGGGWLTASFGSSGFAYTVLGIGAISGVGAGLAYIVPIAVCVRWFPHSRGLVTGVAVAGFGGGAALVSQIGSWLMTAADKTPFAAFALLGACFMVAVAGAGALMRYPDGAGVSAGRAGQPVREILAQPAFRLLYLAMMFGLAAGFLVNANLKELYRGDGEAARIGVFAVALFALANAAGRIVWGALFDRLTAATALQANLLAQMLVFLTAPWLLASTTGFYLLALLTGFNYGGVLVLYVASVSRLWGAALVGPVYGWLFTSNVPASVAPIAAGFAFDFFGSFTPPLYLSAALLLLAIFLLRRSVHLLDNQHD